MLNCERVGIVLATYSPNLGYLRQQLDSIRAQTWSQWVCHIVDDASPPAIQRAIAAMAQTDPRFVCHFHTDNRNVYHNFERGLRYVETDPTLTTLAFADQDDIWQAHKLETLLRTLHSEGALLVHSDLELIDARDRSLHPSVWAFEGRYPERLTTELLLLRNTVTGCTMLFRRSLLSAILPFPPQSVVRWHHDHWVALAAAQSGTIAHVRLPLVQYRQHAANIVGALKRTGTLQQEFQQWLNKGFQVKLHSYQIHRDLSRAFYQRFGICSNEYDTPLLAGKASSHSTNPFDPPQPDWGLNLLRLGWQGYRTNYCPAGITVRLWLGKFLADLSRLRFRSKFG